MYVKGVERSSVLLHIFAHNFLNIYLIFNPKKFGKLRPRAFQPYHQMLCMSKMLKVAQYTL